MKKLLIFLFTVFTIISYGQSFTYDIEGLAPYSVVMKHDSLTSIQLYNKTIDYIKESYINPYAVIKSQIDGKMIRITAVKEGAFYAFKMHANAKYTLKIEFKDGKYRVTPIELSSDDFKIFLHTGKQYYKKNGETYKTHKDFPMRIANVFNEFMFNLNTYIEKKDDW